MVSFSELPAWPYYCEENAVLLASMIVDAMACDPIAFEGVHASVVFVTNASRSVAMFSQRAAPDEFSGVVWDYHVVVVVRGQADECLVYDADNRIACPLSLSIWLAVTFPVVDGIDDALAPMFRVVDAATAVRRFSSTRSHMKDECGAYARPPPPWPPFENGPENLARFLDCEDEIARTFDSIEAFRTAMQESV